MKIVISPAKRMRSHIDFMEASTVPVFQKEARLLLRHLKTLKISEIANMLKCNASIAQWSYQAYHQMKLNKATVPALLSFDGIQYTYMKPDIFTDEQFAYVHEHLRILSGFYGVLRPMDGVMPYRLELDNVFQSEYCSSLYNFWNHKLYDAIVKEDLEILDLTSKQYGKIIHKYKQKHVKICTCYFYEQEQDRLLEKGVYVKMARGEMVRYLAEQKVENFEGVKAFHGLGYQFNKQLSNDETFVFVRSKSILP